MNTINILRSTSGLIAGSLLALSAQAADTEKDALPQPENYVTFAGQLTKASGDKAAFEAQSATARHGFAGIEDLQYTKSLEKDYEMNLSGHALVGNADYLATFKLSNAEIGTFDLGYSTFRTYYDGIGGFFPGNNAWFPLNNQGLSIDRSKLWAGVTLTFPDAPVVSIRYTREERNGTKDTTIWGDTDNAYNPSSGALGNRKIVANYIDVNESRQTLDGTVKYTVGHTTFQASVIGERIDNNNTRYINRYPGESRPVGSAPTAPWNLVNNAIWGSHRDVIQTNSLAALFKVQTELGKNVTAFAGVQYQNVITDLGGDRLLYSTITTTPSGRYDQLGGYITGGRAPGAYNNLVGSSHTKLLTANVGADLKLVKNLFIETALKYEDRQTQNDNSFYSIQNLVNQTTGAITNNGRNYWNSSAYDESAWIPEISLRYNGISKLSLYATAEARFSPGTEQTNYATNSVLTTSTDVEENHARYAVGANWSPISLATFRSEVFYKDHKNDFNALVSTAPADRSQFILGTKYTGARLTLTLKPTPTLSATTRYVYQQGTMELAATGAPIVAGAFTRYPNAESMDSKIHQIAETIDFNPIKQLYFQVGANITFDTTSTAYPVVNAAGSTAITANDVIRDADNNYWSAHALAGVVVDKYTNAEFQYTHYQADNYRSDVYWTTDVGAGEKSYTATIALKRKLTDKLTAALKLGYVKYESDTTGGNTDYSAKVGYLTLQQAF